MKKLSAILLAMIMAMSLAIPAFAAEPDSPSPEDVIPISAILDGDFGVIGGADGPTDIVVEFPAADEYLAAHPGLEEQLRANAYDYFAEEYGGYWTAEEYMETWEMTEEEFLDEMVQEQLYPLLLDVFYQQQCDAVKEALGGVPGQIGVMVNGQYIQFPDAAPEVTNGRTMTPVRALVETLGGEAEMVDGKVICKTDEVSLTFTPGSNEVLVEYPGGELPGDAQVFPMNCAPYIKGGRTYVPVRFIGEALGYEVGWDGDFQTAILLDREALAARIDEDFTILNRVQAARSLTMEEGKNYRADLKGSVTVTAFDTLHGDKTYKADLTGKTLMNTQAADGAYSVSIPDNTVDALLEQLIGGEGPEYEEDAAILRSVITGLKDIEFIMNRDGLVWVHAPILDGLAGEDNVWCGYDLGAELAQAVFGETQAATVGAVLASGISADSVVSWNAAAGMTAQMLYDLYGDHKFTTSGGVSTLTIGLDELAALYESIGMGYAGSELEDTFKEYNITMKVDSSGGVVTTVVMETAPQYGTPAMRVTMDGAQNSKGVSMTMEYHVANVAKVNLTLTTTQQTTSEAPRTEPPQGSTVVDAAQPLNP